MIAYFIDEKGLWHGASAEREECPSDAVTTPPDCEYPRWDGKGWVVDSEVKAEVEEQQRNALISEKMREMAEEKVPNTMREADVFICQQKTELGILREQRGEEEPGTWKAKVAEIRADLPYPEEGDAL